MIFLDTTYMTTDPNDTYELKNWGKRMKDLEPVFRSPTRWEMFRHRIISTIKTEFENVLQLTLEALKGILALYKVVRHDLSDPMIQMLVVFLILLGVYICL